MTNAECKANKECSKQLAAEWMWNWPKTFIVDDGWKNHRSQTLLVDTKQALKDTIS